MALSDVDLINFRKQLHQHPELSGAEQQTAAVITTFLQGLNPDQLVTGLGGHGVAETFSGRNPG